MARLPLAALMALAAAGCGGSPPPTELAGLWSRGQDACAAEIGVRFGPHAIQAVYGDQRETLFERPRYQVEPGTTLRIRIVYDLPRLPGGAHSAGARGVLLLARQPDGSIAPVTHNLSDARTGAVRLRMGQDPAKALLSLSPCGLKPPVARVL